MDPPHRGYYHRDPYLRSSSSSGDGGIPPSSVPSLSTGQGFYTVESLQGATVVPPPQLAPPPPRLLPPEPFPIDRFDRSRPRIPPDDRAFRPPPPHFDRGVPPHLGRRPLPPPDLPPRDFRGGPPGLRPPPPHFMANPRMPGFHPGRGTLPLRERDRGVGWGPSRDWGRDRSRPTQRLRVRKQVQKSKPSAQAKPAVDGKSPAGTQNPDEGGPGWCSVCQIDCFRAETLKKHAAGKRHKRQLEKLNEGSGEAKKSKVDDQVVNEADDANDADETMKETVEEVKEVAKEGEVEAEAANEEDTEDTEKEVATEMEGEKA